MAQLVAGWHAENIKAEIRKKFGTLAKFARHVGLSPQTISGAISGPCVSSRAERLIAQSFGLSPHDIWPDRWTSNQQRIDRSHLRVRRESTRN